MMTSIQHLFTPFIHWVATHPNYGELVTFLVTFSESIAFFGMIVPGSFLLAGIGGLIGSDVLPLWPTLFCAVFGAIIGDTLSFSAGYFFSDSIILVWPFKKYPHWITRGKAFFAKHGGKSVFIGRFMGPLRPITPIIAGILRMPYAKFIIAAILSAWIWAPAYMLPGYLIGAAALAFPHQHFLNILLMTLAALVGLGLVFWLLKKAVDKFQPPLVFWMACAITALLALMATLHHAAVLSDINHFFLTLLQTHRNTPRFNDLMIYLTTSGRWGVICLSTVLFAIYLFFTGQRRVSLHYLAVIIASLGSAWLLKNVMANPRPIANIISLHSFSFPSGHTTLTASCLGFWLMIILSQRPKWQPLSTALILAWIALIGFTRLYLGAHWFTDVLGGLLLSTTIVSAATISLRRRTLNNFNLNKLTLVYLLLFIVIWNGHYWQHQAALHDLYQPLGVHHSFPGKHL